MLYRVTKDHVPDDVNKNIIFSVIISSIVLMYFWVRREIKAVYIRRMLTDQAVLLGKRLEEQERLIASLREMGHKKNYDPPRERRQRDGTDDIIPAAEKIRRKSAHCAIPFRQRFDTADQSGNRSV